MNIPKTGIVNPFSEKFLENWELWKAYKEESHNFKYKGVISEQMALKQLVDLSGGDEEKAIKIINQSIRREWQGLFPLHETTKGKENGKSKSTSKGEQSGSSLREQAVNEFMRRNGGGEQQGDYEHLKAV